MSTRTLSNSGHTRIDIEMLCELSQDLPHSPFVATLWRVERRWFDEDAQPEIVETQVCEAEFTTSLPAVFPAVDEWLLRGHRLLVAPSAWKAEQAGPGTGMLIFLSGQATPCR
ncbi:MAG: hypothetical protein PHQ28_02950 [Mycobacterium sp.]|nr:hypothetical protein [Mycobacterium sp.]